MSDEAKKMTLAVAMRVAAAERGGDLEVAWGVVARNVRCVAARAANGSVEADDLAHDLLVGWFASPSKLAEGETRRDDAMARAFVRSSVERRMWRAAKTRRNAHGRENAWLRVHAPVAVEARQDERARAVSFASDSALLDMGDSPEEVLVRLRDTLCDALRVLATRRDSRRNALASLHQRHEVAFAGATVASLVEAALPEGASARDAELARQSMNRRHSRMRAMLLTPARELQPTLVCWLNTKRLTRPADLALVRRYLDLVVA